MVVLRQTRRMLREANPLRYIREVMGSRLGDELSDSTLSRKTSSESKRARTETDTGGQVENTKATGETLLRNSAN